MAEKTQKIFDQFLLCAFAGFCAFAVLHNIFQ